MKDTICSDCRHVQDGSCYGEKEQTACPSYNKAQTNGNRIRSMTDEELAIMLNMHQCGLDCPNGEFDKHKCYMHESCYHCWLDWLKQEVEE